MHLPNCITSQFVSLAENIPKLEGLPSALVTHGQRTMRSCQMRPSVPVTSTSNAIRAVISGINALIVILYVIPQFELNCSGHYVVWTSWLTWVRTATTAIPKAGILAAMKWVPSNLIHYQVLYSWRITANSLRWRTIVRRSAMHKVQRVTNLEVEHGRFWELSFSCCSRDRDGFGRESGSQVLWI